MLAWAGLTTIDQPSPPGKKKFQKPIDTTPKLCYNKDTPREKGSNHHDHYHLRNH